MPSILFSDSSESWGGLQHWMHSVAAGLQTRGWETALAVSEEVEKELDVEPIPESPPGQIDNEIRRAADGRSRRRVARYDLVVAGTGRDIRSLGLTAKYHKTPLVWRVGGIPNFTWYHGLTRDQLVSHILVPSHYARGLMIKAGWEPHAVTAIANGISIRPVPTPTDVAAARQSLGWQDGEFVVLFVGSLRRVKRIDILIDAFAQIAPTRPELRLILVGAGKKRHDLEEQVLRLALTERVKVTGFQRNPSSYFTGCDLFVLPSREETFGFVLLEAMMRGKPIVASDAGAVPEVVGLDEAALLVDSSTPEALAHGIRRVIEDATLRQRLGGAGPQRVKERFTEEMMLDQLDAYFRSLIR